MTSDEADEPIRVERVIPASPPATWAAITRPAAMRPWFFEEIEDFEPRSGFDTRFDVRVGPRTFRHHWVVLEAAPPRRLVVRWRYAGIPGDSRVVWILAGEPGGTRVVLEHHGHATFPRDDAVFGRKACTGGWTWFLDRLAAEIARRDDGPGHGDAPAPRDIDPA